MARAPEIMVRICVQGASNSGKSALLQRFLQDRFEDRPYEPTRGLSELGTQLYADHEFGLGRPVRLQVQDIPGGALYRESNKHHRAASAFVVTLDLTDRAEIGRA